jgi:hypothetical protein
MGVTNECLALPIRHGIVAEGLPTPMSNDPEPKKEGCVHAARQSRRTTPESSWEAGHRPARSARCLGLMRASTGLHTWPRNARTAKPALVAGSASIRWVPDDNLRYCVARASIEQIGQSDVGPEPRQQACRLGRSAGIRCGRRPRPLLDVYFYINYCHKTKRRYNQPYRLLTVHKKRNSSNSYNSYTIRRKRTEIGQNYPPFCP